MLPELSSAVTVRPKEAFAVTLAGGVVVSTSLVAVTAVVFSTVTVTGAEVAVFPAPSVAMAVSVCWLFDTLVVFQENV